MTHLCVAILVTDLAKAKRGIAVAAEAGADMVELRIDHGPDTSQVQALIRDAVVPCILTCRPTWEGGLCEQPEDERLLYLSRVGRDDATYIDVELRAKAPLREVTELPRDIRPGAIRSFHDFTGRPDRLYQVLEELNASEADILKIVWTARTIRDNLEAFEVLQQKQKPTIALCMGEAGLISRVLAKKFGGFLTFATLDGDAGTAPGQISISEMKKLYRWDAINEKTKVYGVVASPVKHSMSPAIHNAAFDAIGYDGVYLPLLVEEGYESFKAFMETFIHFRELDLSGLSVTIPHKQNALRYLKEKGAQVEALAGAIGAINTIVIDRGTSEPRMRGFNTDYAAILDSITAALGIDRESLGGRRVAVLGAGGTGRAAVAALAHYGAEVTVYNRTKERGDALAAEFDGHGGRVASAAIEDLGGAQPSIVVNTTSVGMHPKVDQSPLDDTTLELTAEMLVFDAVYNPMRTKLLGQAQAAGSKTVGGVEMFVRQAAAQFQAWTGALAPVSVMRQVIEARLGR
jgi:3-dehydroquinate dehydratase / shikimate dehydrogenase